MPMWQGQNLDGKHLYLFCEQGFGDILQFVRFVPLIPGDCKIAFMVPDEMRALFEASLKDPRISFMSNNFHGAHGASAERLFAERQLFEASNIKADYYVPLCTLPSVFHKIGLPFKLWGGPYLKAPQKEAILRTKGVRKTVGVVWAGDVGHQNNYLRSMKSPHDMVETLLSPGVELYSLQYGGYRDDPLLVGPMGLVRDLSPQIKNFADTAALIQQLDEVVTVDTAAAHLVGALGKPGHVLLAHGAIDWRWMVKTDKTPWYPTLKLHRQKPGQSWRDLLTEVRL
jgi:hypothetical protein